MGFSQPQTKADCLRKLERLNEELAQYKSELAMWQHADKSKYNKRSLDSYKMNAKDRIEHKKAEISTLKARMKTLK